MTHSMNVTEHAQLQIQERNVWALANPAAIQVYKEYPPGFTQYGCCACLPAPTWWPGLSCLPCVLPPSELRNTMAASKFIRITEQGLMWNFAYFGMRDQCLGIIPCNLCCWKVLDDVTYMPWDDPAMDQIKVARRCAICDCCTVWGCFCGPYTCGTKFTKTCFPCCDVWPFKVCYIEGCDERMQYCNGGYGTNIKFRQTFCGGCCVRAYPGICCLCPTGCSGIGKFCCVIPHAFDVFVRPEEAQDFVATMNQFKQERLKVIKVQPR